MSMAEIESQGQREAAQSASPYDPTTQCWYCGERIEDPQLIVEEGIYSYGVYQGFHFTGVIHESCAKKAEKEFSGYKWRVIPKRCSRDPSHRDYSEKVYQNTGGEARYCYDQLCRNPCHLQYRGEN